MRGGGRWGARPPEFYVHADGRLVTVPGRVAYQLDRLLDLNALRSRVRGEDPELDAVLVALRLAAMVAVSEDGQPTRTLPDPDASLPWLTTQAAADRLDVDPRTVRRACQEGRLPARRAGRSWVVSREALEQYAAQRDRVA